MARYGNAHGKVSGGSLNLFLVDGGDGDRQVWTADEYESASVATSNLEDALNTLRSVERNLPSTFETSDIENAIEEVDSMLSWYYKAISSAEEI